MVPTKIGSLLSLIFADPIQRKLIMDAQMSEAERISDAVPRADDLPVDYQPANYFNFGKPVRVA